MLQSYKKDKYAPIYSGNKKIHHTFLLPDEGGGGIREPGDFNLRWGGRGR